MISWTRTWPELAALLGPTPSAGQACPEEMCCQLSRLVAKEDFRDRDIVTRAWPYWAKLSRSFDSGTAGTPFKTGLM